MSLNGEGVNSAMHVTPGRVQDRTNKLHHNIGERNYHGYTCVEMSKACFSSCQCNNLYW